MITTVAHPANHSIPIQIEFGPHSNYDRLSNIHNIILGSLTIGLTAAGFGVKACVRYCRARWSIRAKHGTSDAEAQVCELELAPMAPPPPYSSTSIDNNDCPNPNESNGDHESGDIVEEIVEFV